MNVPVHQWFPYQAQFIWSTPEIQEHLPQQWSNSVTVLNSYDITNGTWYEDEEVDMNLYSECNDVGPYEFVYAGRPWCQHFWVPDNGSNAGLLLNKQWDSAYKRAQKLWDTKVIPLYNSGQKD